MSARTSRPLRFLTMTVVGWIGLRVAILWHGTGSLPAIAPVLSIAQSAAALTPRRRRDRSTSTAPGPAPRLATVAPAPALPRRSGPSRNVRTIALAMTGLVRFGPARLIQRREPILVSPAIRFSGPNRTAGALRSRWSGDAWLLVRGGRRRGAGFGAGQLGGSQAGVRLAYALDRRHRLALYGRLDSPLHGAGSEAAAGVEWRPSRLPARLVAEARLPLDGGKAAPVVGVIAGLDPTPIAAGFRLEAYGQAGAIDRDGVHGFADGAARLTHPLATVGRARVDIGGGAWGGAQRDAARLDIGPTLGVAFRLGALPARLTVDWRQRIAGRARPGSGIAVSLGADF